MVELPKLVDIVSTEPSDTVSKPPVVTILELLVIAFPLGKVKE